MAQTDITEVRFQIGQRIKSRRNQLNYTQATLGRLTAASSAQVGNWESGASPHLDTFILLCEVLDVSFAWLLTGEEQEPWKKS